MSDETAIETILEEAFEDKMVVMTGQYRGDLYGP